MADILIRNVKIPYCCNLCVGGVVYQKGSDGWWHDYCRLTEKIVNLDSDERPEDCPLVQLVPHGDLLDKDEVKDEFLGLWNRHEKSVEMYGEAEALPFDIMTVFKAIDDIPLVLEADNET